MKTLQERDDPIGRIATPTLVFAVGGRIGSGASFVMNALSEELKAFGYGVEKIKITKRFLDAAAKVEDWLSRGDDVRDQLYERNNDLFEDALKPFRLNSTELSPRTRQVLILQRRGNLLRKKYGNNFLAALCIDDIGSELEKQSGTSDPKMRVAYILDSLKHPAEVDLLRTVFRDAFCMIGVVADDSVRKRRLNDQKHIATVEFDAISEIDAEEREKHGQHATDTILAADYFFENNYDRETKIKGECSRLLNLLFQSSIETPRRDEYGMHLAFMAADKSACLSRQVGAAIIASDGSVLATGHNDVPQFGGGLYSVESEEDNRCFAKSRMCHNDDEKRIISEEIVHTLKINGLGITEEEFERMKGILLKETRLKMLIEFSRAVHAEMEALISVARSAKPGLIGSTMYVTTYPCHNCAKHIIDAGIQEVVFLEPYVKSLAQKLHHDAINNPMEPRALNRVTFSNYGGVSPGKYSEWFSKHGERKKDSKLIPKSQNKDTMLPLCAIELETLKSQHQMFRRWFKDMVERIGSPTGEAAQTLRSTEIAVADHAL
ncbi:MAG: hypothetical protein ABS79_03845 [Planctomycetes bacterium SCN 63-9]|mgnify:CR=1 FL=1|nr:MAG: hypothetical protein ABS79_03845 [Planctomycetes bacterium SCN 63-9]